MSAPVPPQQPSTSGFVGWLLIAVGALMALLCGGCTLAIWVSTIADAIHSAGGAEFLLVGLLGSAVIGGVPALGGVVLVWAGWRTLRPRRGKAVDETFT